MGILILAGGKMASIMAIFMKFSLTRVLSLKVGMKRGKMLVIWGSLKKYLSILKLEIASLIQSFDG